MTAIAMSHFDALGYVKKSRELGVPEPVAEYQARQIEQSIEIAVNTARTEIENKELATKKDIEKNVEVLRKEMEKNTEMLRKEIALSNIKMIIWIGGFLFASGLIQHFFK